MIETTKVFRMPFVEVFAVSYSAFNYQGMV